MLNDRIAAWLVIQRKTREELAGMLNISPRTIDGWLSSQKRPIPARMHAAIEEIIAPKSEPGCILLQLNIPDEVWKGVKERLHIDSDEEAKEVAAQQMLAFFRALQVPINGDDSRE
jgi:transcriptional regulator with XRE-family HTH domain